MSRIKLKQILSNLYYSSSIEQLIVSGSGNPSFIISGSAVVAPLNTTSGSLTIKGFDTFGDSGSADTVDLGSY